MRKSRLITKPPKGTKIIPDVVHRNFTPIVDVWRLYAVPAAADVLVPRRSAASAAANTTGGA